MFMIERFNLDPFPDQSLSLQVDQIRSTGRAELDRAFAIVVDIGKTLSKVTLWSRAGIMLDRQARPNAARSVDGIARLDVDGIGAWLIEVLGRYRDEPIEAIIPVGHGAGVAALVGDALAFPPLDYEHAIPTDIMAEYRDARDAFALTGSPALPDGLNMGAQLHWLERLYPREMARATLLPWAQYWAWFLSGVAMSEVTSLACHSDLWLPGEGRFSPMAERRGWAGRFAPLARAGDAAGRLQPELAQATGLSPTIAVLAGMHDSNAALLAARGFTEVQRQEATILSTGTWFIAMRLPGETVSTASLAEHRDCLINVDAYGRQIPSARFMGGREIEIVVESDEHRIDIAADQPALVAAASEVVAAGTMLLPTLAPGCGPFPEGEGRWIARPGAMLQRRAGAALYAALVADASLDLVGAKDRLLVEGRFAGSEVFVRALAALRPGTRVYTASADNDVSFGALRLIEPGLVPAEKLELAEPLPADLQSYRVRWRAEIANDKTILAGGE